MSEPPASAVPPFGEDTDEALNALIDGELGDFARERGLTEKAVRARLEAWPGSSTRLADLERVHRALQAPVPPLDDLTRRRLVRNAVTGLPAPTASPRRSRSWGRVTAVAAAALLVFAGIGVVLSSIEGNGRSASDSASSARSGAGSSATDPLRGDVGDLGDVTSPEALRALLERRAAEAPASSTTSPAGADASASALVPQAGHFAPPLSNRDDGKPAPPAACAREVAGARDVVFTGTGTYQRAPVTIVGIADGARTIVFVVSSTDCTNVLTSISR